MAAAVIGDTVTVHYTGSLDDDSRERLDALCQKAVERFLKEHAEASVA